MEAMGVPTLTSRGYSPPGWFGGFGMCGPLSRSVKVSDFFGRGGGGEAVERGDRKKEKGESNTISCWGNC